MKLTKYIYCLIILIACSPVFSHARKNETKFLSKTYQTPLNQICFNSLSKKNSFCAKPLTCTQNPILEKDKLSVLDIGKNRLFKPLLLFCSKDVKKIVDGKIDKSVLTCPRIITNKYDENQTINSFCGNNDFKIDLESINNDVDSVEKNFKGDYSLINNFGLGFEIADEKNLCKELQEISVKVGGKYQIPFRYIRGPEDDSNCKFEDGKLPNKERLFSCNLIIDRLINYEAIVSIPYNENDNVEALSKLNGGLLEFKKKLDKVVSGHGKIIDDIVSKLKDSISKSNDARDEISDIDNKIKSNALNILAEIDAEKEVQRKADTLIIPLSGKLNEEKGKLEILEDITKKKLATKIDIENKVSSLSDAIRALKDTQAQEKAKVINKVDQEIIVNQRELEEAIKSLVNLAPYKLSELTNAKDKTLKSKTKDTEVTKVLNSIYSGNKNK